MIKLFELPIYHYDKQTFEKKYSAIIRKRRQEYAEEHGEMDEKHFSALMYYSYYPKSLWEYNQIDGYLVVSIDRRDVLFEEFSVFNPPEKYCWDSKVKRFFEPARKPGMHLYSKGWDNQTFRERISAFLVGFGKELKKSGRYLDLECFYNLVEFLDFERIAEKEG